MSDDNLMRSIALGEKALGYMKYNQTEADPKNYEFWYTYASGINREFIDDVKKSLSEQSRLEKDEITKLYEKHFGTKSKESRMNQIGAMVSSELEDIMGLVESSVTETSKFGNNLQSFTSQIDQVDDPSQLKTMITSLVSATVEMAKQSSEIQSNLENSQKTIAKLNDDIEQIRSEALTDALTGIANRKCFDKKMGQVIEAAKEEPDTSLCLMMLDIDHFKSFNDNYGHQTGDQIIRLVGSILKANVKGKDLAARYGGEEFAVILPQTELASATILAEQIRQAIQNKELMKKNSGEKLGRVTISIGVSQLKPQETADTLIARADKSLYLAKECGRNLVKTEKDLAADVNDAAA